MARKIEVAIVGDASQLTRELKKAENASARSGGRFKHLGAMAAGAGVAIGATLVVGLEKSFKAAMNAQVATARLDAAFKASGMEAGRYSKQINKAERAGRNLGFTDEETKNSLGSLIVATHNMRKATVDLGVAQNIARFKGIDLQAATKMLTMAMGGSQRAAKQLGLSVQAVTTEQDKARLAFNKAKDSIDAHYKALGKLTPAQEAEKQAALDNAKAQYEGAKATAQVMDKQVTAQKVIDLTKKKLEGQAEAYSKTLPGAIAEARAWLEHFEVELGNKLLPIAENVITWLKENWPQISATIKQAWEQIKPTLVAFEQLVVNLVATIKKHWGTIGPIVMGVVKIVREQLQIITGVIQFFAAVLKGDWGAAWAALKKVVTGVFGEIKAVLGLQLTVLKDAAVAIGKGIIHGVKSGLEEAWTLLKTAISDLFHKAIGWVKDVLGIKSPSTVFHGIGVNMIKGMVGGIGSMGGYLKDAVVKLAKSVPGKVLGVLSGGAPGGKGFNSVEGAQGFARQYMANYGWGGNQWGALQSLWNGESGWRWNAKNQSSGAYGIPQALPAAKMASAGSDWLTSAATQIKWGLRYIKDRYGSPNNAYSAWLSRSPHWYKEGGIFTQPSIIGVGESGPEAVVPLSRGGASVTANIVLDGRVLASALIDPLRGEVRQLRRQGGRL